MRVVIDAPNHPQNLAPSGGSIIDFAPVGMTTSDQINGIYQVAGLLPRDAVHYETWQQEMGDAYVAAILRGHLEGNPRVTVVTRYELRPCEPGVRVRSDLYNGAADPNTLYLSDGFFWGDQTLAPFVPGPGLGFRAPEVELLHIDRAWREWPLMAARSQGSRPTSHTPSSPAIGPRRRDSAAPLSRRRAFRSHRRCPGTAFPTSVSFSPSRGRGWRPRSRPRCAFAPWFTAIPRR